MTTPALFVAAVMASALASSLWISFALMATGLAAIEWLRDLPVALPLVLGAGFDKIWFGIFLVAVIELSNVTPPVGFNLFVIQQMTGSPQLGVVRAALPFAALLCVLCALLTAVPELATWLPRTMKG